MPPVNQNLVFHLTRGNPSNFPCGIGLDKQVFGRSMGGKLFRKEVLANKEIIYHQLTQGTQEVFDPIVPTDIIKSKVNYRAIFIANYGIEHSILDTVVCSAVVADPGSTIAVSDVDIAVEGVFTTAEVSRAIPAAMGQAGNPSIFLDDEYDSTNKLAALTFKKTLDASDLPTDIPFDAVLKIWIRREMVVDKLNLPDQELDESFTLTVNEYNGVASTPLEISYKKIEGRVPLANWYDFTITPGKGRPVVMRELLPKDVDLTEINILKVFVENDKVLIFYYTQPDAVTKNYMLLVVEPSDISERNKYVQIMLNFDPALQPKEALVSRNQIDLRRSYYSLNKFYIFWSDNFIVDDTCVEQHFGYINRYDRISVDELDTTIWTDDIFKSINPGYANRRVETYDLLDHKVVRQYSSLVNVEQYDDLFILFSRDSRNRGLLDLENINLNRSQLLYLFEKDIIDSKKYTDFEHYPGDSAEVFSQRLYPVSMPTVKQATSFNNAKTPEISLIISDSSTLDSDASSPRTIKSLLDGSRYVDLNSVHGREFKIGNRFVTYELPPDLVDFTNLFFNTSIAITNDEAIYSQKKISFLTNTVMNNIVDGDTYERPLFQQNIIDAADLTSLSIPLEWADRDYRDEWVSILSTLPSIVQDQPVFTLQYNFHRNLWQVIYFDENGDKITKIYDYLVNQSTIITETPSTPNTIVTTGGSGSPGFGKLYTELDIRDMPYVLEPDVYQPFSVKISTSTVYSDQGVQRYLVNFQVFFKGNEVPLVDVITFTTNIANLSYIFVNPTKDLNIRMNYLDVRDSAEFTKEYFVKNTHASFLNKLIPVIGKEFKVNPQLSPEQAEFRHYRKIQINGLTEPSATYDQGGDITLPILLYGSGYTNDETNAMTTHLGVKYPFDFAKVAINDRSMRFYTDSNSSKPLSFKIGYYDYSKDYAVVWVRLKDFSPTSKLVMYYGKIDTTDNIKEIKNSYLSLKSNLYPTTVYGAWQFERVVNDDRLAFNEGKIFTTGIPVIYEKSFYGDISLTTIDKEYMYGIAKVYKSNYFNINIEIPAEESLFIDPKTKGDFINFIKSVATVLKPSYTEINEIKQFGIDVIEAGESEMGQTTNRRVAGLVAMAPNSNVNSYYDRIDDTRFNLLTSINGYSNKLDWIVAKTVDTSLFKSGVLKINGKTKSETIKFESPFKNNDYFVFVASPTNQKLYWNLLCPNRFTVTASHFLLKEVSWMAFHRDIFGGVYTPNSIFVGSRTLTGSVETSGGESPTVPNLPTWYNNELWIQPSIAVQGDPGSMVIDPTDPGYSLILSSNENINIYWTEKNINDFRIKTSSPAPSVVHWLVVRNGVEWWEELV